MAILLTTTLRTKSAPIFRVGIAGPVGAGKTTLLGLLCKAMRTRWDIVAITNDLYSKEDRQQLITTKALAPERIFGVETGGQPYVAIAQDVSLNLLAIGRLLTYFPDADIVFIESGGANLATTFSPELSDLTIYVIDVAAGDKTSRKGGPGITTSDFLLINKTDLAPYVNADLSEMYADTVKMRTTLQGLRPFAMTNFKDASGLDDVVSFIHASAVAWYSGPS